MNFCVAAPRELREPPSRALFSVLPVQHRVCVTSLDWLAADRVAIELMGIPFADVGYLNYCADARLGEADLRKIEILGPAVGEHIKKYKLAANLQHQLVWKEKVKSA